MKVLLALASLVFCLISACTDPDPTNIPSQENEFVQSNDGRISLLTTFGKEAYKQDLQDLVRLLTENHPRLYEYIDQKDFEALVDKKVSELSDGMTVGAFIWLCRSLVAEIGCGHTVIPTLGSQYFLPDSLRFPVNVNWINGKLYVIDPMASSPSVSTGDEILSINGRDADEIVQSMFDHIAADAGNSSMKLEYVNVDFMEYAAFDFDFMDRYEVALLQANGGEKTKLRQLSNSTVGISSEATNESALRFEIDVDVAIITIASFNYYREHFDQFKTFIDGCFNEIKEKKLDKLIIDLRGNGGGDPYCGSYLLKHIAHKPFRYYKRGTYAYDDLEEFIEPHENGFDGKPVILIDGRCFSTTGQLCALIKEHDFGTFVGTETGAAHRCNAAVQSFVLPNTKVNAFIASKTFEAAVSVYSEARSIVPDYEVKNDIQDILEGTDAPLEAGKKLLLDRKRAH